MLLFVVLTGSTSLVNKASLGALRSVDKVWQHLMHTGWNGYCLTSPLSFARLTDILVFLAWSWTHQSKYNLWITVAQHWLPEILEICGAALDALLQELSQLKLSPVPMDQHQGVRPKMVDAVNRLILLDRIKKQKLHRFTIATTHTDVVPQSTRMMQEECFYNSKLYSETCAAAFKPAHQIQISFFSHY